MQGIIKTQTKFNDKMKQWSNELSQIATMEEDQRKSLLYEILKYGKISKILENKFKDLHNSLPNNVNIDISKVKVLDMLDGNEFQTVKNDLRLLKRNEHYLTMGQVKQLKKIVDS